MKRAPTISDVLDAISAFAENVDERFNKVDERFAKVDQRFEQIDERFDRLEKRMGIGEGKIDGLEKRLIRVESQMVTKSYLDDKLADLRGDTVQMIRRMCQR